MDGYKTSECDRKSEYDDTLNSAHNSKRGKIYAVNCGFPIIKRTSQKYGMTEVKDEHGPWTLNWSDRFPTYEKCRLMKRHQQINHIPGILSICRKDELANNLKRMLKLFPKQYDFFPKTWVLPGELKGLLNHAKQHPNQTFILKPSRGSLGRGIYITKTIEHLDLLKMMIGQVYIHKPFLIDGFKFDLRLYVLIASCNPLRIYVYNEGLARFATQKYELLGNNLHLKYMHLTNYSVNKNSSTFINDEFEGSKRKLSTIHSWLIDNGYNAVKVWNSIDDVIVKTVLTALPHMRHNYKIYFPSHTDTIAAFELLGFDFILDNKLKPWLLEVNHTPSFTRCTQLDREVKDPLILDLFNILNLSEDESDRIQEDEKSFLDNRLRNKSTALGIEKSTIRKNIKKREIWEREHLGQFRMVFPSDNATNYKPYINSLLAFSKQREEFGEIRGRQLRKNPFKFKQAQTVISNNRTMQNLLLTSYHVLENIHKDITNISKLKLLEEINEGRKINFNLEEKYINLYTLQKALLTKGVKTVLKTISNRTDILTEDKDKLSSIFLDPPTFMQDDRKSCIGFSDDDDVNPKDEQSSKRVIAEPIKGFSSHVTDIEELDFIPGIVYQNGNNANDVKPGYSSTEDYKISYPQT